MTELWSDFIKFDFVKYNLDFCLHCKYINIAGGYLIGSHISMVQQNKKICFLTQVQLGMHVQIVIHRPRLLLSCSSASPSSLRASYRLVLGALDFCHISLSYMISVVHSYIAVREFGKFTVSLGRKGNKFHCSRR